MKSFKYNNLFKILLVFLLFNVFFISRVSAESIIVDDNFINSTDLDHYTIYENNGNVSIENGKLVLTAPSGMNFPFVYLSRELPTNFEAQVDFNYERLHNFGTGIVFAEELPENGISRDNRDKSLYFMWGDSSSARLNKVLTKSPVSVTTLFSNEDDTFEHTVTLRKLENTYQIWFDGTLLDTFQSENRRVKFLYFGNPSPTYTTDQWSSIAIDRLIIKDLDATDDFPYLSQKDPRWGAEEYDHASQWAAADHQGIANWGCALTSAAMIFQHFGVKSLTGQEITPPILNNWLNNQPDGYIGNGLVNWIALTRYAKESREAGQSPTSLEFTTTAYNPQTTYETPSILNLPGHFVVGYDQTDSQFKIKDPADATKETIDKTSARIKRIDRFIPSNTDLSYFLFTINPEFEIKLKDENGNEIGQVFEQEPLVDDMTPDATISGNQNLKVLMVAKPPQGDFELWVTNPNTNDQNYSLKEFFYDHEGQVEVKEEQEHLLGQHSDVYHFSYGGNVGETSTPISIDSILQILDSYHDSLKVKEFYYRYVHNWLSTAQQETNSQRQKEIMTGLRQVVENNSMVIETPARLDIQNRINQWLENH